MQNPDAFYPVAPDEFMLNSQGLYIQAAPGDIEPYTLDWRDSIDYAGETIASVAWSTPLGVATAPNSALYCAPLETAIVPSAITNGSLALSVNGGPVTNVTGISLSGLTTLIQVAAAIQTAVRAALSDTTSVTFDIENDRFVFSSPSTGITGSVSFLSPAGTGTDLSSMLGGQSGAGGYQALGVTASSIVGPLTSIWIATPVAGTYLVQATIVSTFSRIKSKSFELQVG